MKPTMIVEFYDDDSYKVTFPKTGFNYKGVNGNYTMELTRTAPDVIATNCGSPVYAGIGYGELNIEIRGRRNEKV